MHYPLSHEPVSAHVNHQSARRRMERVIAHEAARTHRAQQIAATTAQRPIRVSPLAQMRRVVTRLFQYFAGYRGRRSAGTAVERYSIR